MKCSILNFVVPIGSRIYGKGKNFRLKTKGICQFITPYTWYNYGNHRCFVVGQRKPSAVLEVLCSWFYFGNGIILLKNNLGFNKIKGTSLKI
jgi:hypothetical protein